MVKMGQRFRALDDLQVEVVPAWGPHDARSDVVLPAGEAFAIGPEPAPGAAEAYCVALDYDRLHEQFVPESWLSDELFHGYYLRISLDDIARRCEFLGEWEPQPVDPRLVIKKLEALKGSGYTFNPEMLAAIDEELAALRSRLTSPEADA